MRLSILCASLALSCFGVTSARAAIITNPSFDADTQTDGTFTERAIAGWTFGGYTAIDGTNRGLANPNGSSGFEVTPVFGNNIGYLYANTNSRRPYLSQDLGAQTANTIYSVSGYVGDRLGTGAIATDFPTSVGIRLMVGNILLTSQVASVVITTSPTNGTAALYTTSTYTSTASPVGNLFLVLDIVGGSNYRLATFDNLVLNAVPVPEPSSLLVALLGMPAMAMLRRKNSCG